MNNPCNDPIPSRYIWLNAWASPYESPYTLVSKFAWANAISPSVLCKWLFGRISNQRNAWTFFSMEWIRFSEATYSTPFPILSAFEESWDLYRALPLFNDSAIRFCATCLQQNFHTVFFQMDALERCPIHSCALQNTCSHCNATTESYGITREGFDDPFQCPRCHSPLAGSFSEGAFRATPQEKALRLRRLQPWSAWCNRLMARLDFQCAANDGTSEALVRFQRPELTPQAINGAVANSIIPSPNPSAMVSLHPGLQLQKPLDELGFKKVRPEVDYERSRDTSYYHPLLKSIRRYLYRRYLRRHRRCVQCAIRAVRLTRPFGDARLDVLDYVCPIAQAYVRWLIWFAEFGYFRSRWGPVVRWHSMSAHLDSTSGYSEEQKHGWSPLIHFHVEAVLLWLMSKHLRWRGFDSTDALDSEQLHKQENIVRRMYEASFLTIPRGRSATFYLDDSNSEERSVFVVGPDTSFALQLANEDPAVCRRLAKDFFRHYRAGHVYY